MQKAMALALLALSLAACGQMQPFAPHKASEVPDGPGLFTGKDGAFYILRGAPDTPSGPAAR